MYSDLAGKVVVVTGAGRPRGIGRATALRFAREGAKVVVVDLPTQSRRVSLDVLGIAPDLQAVADEIKAAGGEASAVPADVSQAKDVDALVDAVVDLHGQLDVMVCNAAVTHDHGVALTELSAEVFARVLAVNLTGTFLCAKAAAAHMIDTGIAGNIITVGSRASRRGNPNIIAYSASKFGVLGLSQSLSLALAPHRIRVNCVCPGSVDTDMAAAEIDIAHHKTGRSEAELEARAIAGVPLGRLTSPQDLANTICWMASTQSEHITGQAINVNGGSWLS